MTFSPAIVLFQGDSITDAGRDRAIAEPNRAEAMGRGYALHAASTILADNPGHAIHIYNRGISGNKVTDLANRWQEDCLDLKPNLLSVLIGVNDTSHGTGSGNPEKGVPLDHYEQVYCDLLNQAFDAQPDLQLVICEPFALRCGRVNDRWFPEMDQRRERARKIADAFHATFVPFQTMFDQACEQAPPEYWAPDGIHPSLAGHQRMARTWLDAVGGSSIESMFAAANAKLGT